MSDWGNSWQGKGAYSMVMDGWEMEHEQGSWGKLMCMTMESPEKLVNFSKSVESPEELVSCSKSMESPEKLVNVSKA